MNTSVLDELSPAERIMALAYWEEAYLFGLNFYDQIPDYDAAAAGLLAHPHIFRHLTPPPSRLTARQRGIVCEWITSGLAHGQHEAEEHSRGLLRQFQTTVRAHVSRGALSYAQVCELRGEPEHAARAHRYAQERGVAA